MNFDYSSEQQAIADSVIKFVEREYDWDTRLKLVRTGDGRGSDHWETFAELGWLGAGLDEDAGGFGGGAAENAIIAEQLGKAVVNEPFATHVIAINLIASSDNGPVRDLVEPIIMGETRVAIAFHEKSARGDFSQVATHYKTSGEGYLLTGEKSLVEAAAGADRIIIPAMGADGLGLFIVDAGAPGMTLRPYRLLDNRRVCDISLNDVAVDASAVIALGEAAQSSYNLAIDHGLLTLGAEALGTMQAALWDTRDYLLTRTQFRVPLASFQVLQHRMADMLIEVEMTRSLLFHALGAMDGATVDRQAAVSALKAQVGRAGLHVAREAIQMHGGIGVTDELAISHHYRRLYVVDYLLGGQDLHLERFAAQKDNSCD